MAIFEIHEMPVMEDWLSAVAMVHFPSIADIYLPS